MLYQYDIKENLTKDRIDGPLRYRRSCLRLYCERCFRNNSISHVTFFEEHLEMLAEGIFCPNCNNTLLPDNSFINMVKEHFYDRFNMEVHSSTKQFIESANESVPRPSVTLVFNSFKQSVEVDILPSGEGWTLDLSKLRKFQELYELTLDQIRSITEGIRYFNFIDWHFTLCSQNADDLTIHHNLDIIKLPHEKDED